MEGKKSFVLTDAIIYLAIGALIFLVLVFIVPKMIGSGASQASDYLSSSKDFDNDGVADYFDRCVCVYAATDDGCSSTMTDEQKSKSKYDSCPQEMNPTTKKTK